MNIKDARRKYYEEKQISSINDLAKAHIRLYEEYMDRSFRDAEEAELFHKVYTIIKDAFDKDGLIQ